MGEQITYSNGTAQNYFNETTREKYFIYTHTSGQQVTFPNAIITTWWAFGDAGWAGSNRVIHASTSLGLGSIEHEYGHLLQLDALGGSEEACKWTIMIPSFQDATTYKPRQHDFFWTEVWANNLAAQFFGPNSTIALNPNLWPQN